MPPPPAAAAAAAPLDPTLEIRAATTNVRPNFEGGANDVTELRAQGIEVEDDNEPVIENAGPPPAGPALVGTCIKPAICARRSLNATNSAGSWEGKSWTQIADMDEFSLFCLAFPERYFIDVIILETNKQLPGDNLTLQEFYVWLGLNFLMGAYEGVSDRREW